MKIYGILFIVTFCSIVIIILNYMNNKLSQILSEFSNASLFFSRFITVCINRLTESILILPFRFLFRLLSDCYVINLQLDG